ncbi:MAG: hypothetical protein A2Z44_07205 [Betaproteobacteria bacterium RBG_19FT_COMBO_58_11]|nr:MAG: hypothetical protein A2Z44_07205 [Betaproteobacteria bacterium RBG_19FT_COMBO_58_11]
MKNRLAAAIFLSLILVNGATSAQIIVGNLGLEKLPPTDSRKVVGTWKLKEMTCTRSIEQAHSRYFMVARCDGGHSDDKGILLAKLSDNLYQSQANGWSYEIAETGILQVRNRSGAVILNGEPHPRLWP